MLIAIVSSLVVGLLVIISRARKLPKLRQTHAEAEKALQTAGEEERRVVDKWQAEWHRHFALDSSLRPSHESVARNQARETNRAVNALQNARELAKWARYDLYNGKLLSEASLLRIVGGTVGTFVIVSTIIMMFAPRFM